MKTLMFVLMAGLLFSSAPSRAGSPTGSLRDGDLVFHTSRSAQSEAIQLATDSTYSHVGVVLHQDARALRHPRADERAGRFPR